MFHQLNLPRTQSPPPQPPNSPPPNHPTSPPPPPPPYSAFNSTRPEFPLHNTAFWATPARGACVGSLFPEKLI